MKLSHIVLVMIALLCLASEPLPRDASGQPTNKANDKYSDGQQYHRDAIPIAVATQADTRIATEVSDRGQHEKDQKQDTDLWMVAFTGLIAILGFFQLLTFLSQRRVTLFAERAQLVILPIPPLGPIAVTGFAVGQHPKFNGHIMNIGNTPAYALTYDVWLELVGPPFTDFPEGTRVGRDSEAKTVYPQPVGALSWSTNRSSRIQCTPASGDKPPNAGVLSPRLHIRQVPHNRPLKCGARLLSR